MSGFVNEFAFSFSGWRTFRACPRRWWLSKVRFWRGWEKNAGPDARLAYLLTKMQTYFSLAGALVHEFARDFVASPRGRGPQQLVAEFGQRFERAEAQSRNGAWRAKPKAAVNLFEHYYRHPDAAGIRARAHAFGVRALGNLPTAAVVARARRGRVLQAEMLEKMHISGIPVWVQIDLVSKVDDLLYLVDYKTGRPKLEHRAQGMLYALFALDERGAAAENIRVALSYLSDGSEELIAPSTADLDELRATILEAALTITERLQPPAGGGALLNRGREEDFPGVDDPAICADCSMYHACKGTREIRWPEPVRRTA